MAFAVNAPVDCDPFNALVPDQSPEALHAVAFCVDQVSVAAAPELTELGAAPNVIKGGNALTVTVAD